MATGLQTSTLTHSLSSTRATVAWRLSPQCAPPARFGRLELAGSRVVRFGEKAADSEGHINGGFFVLEKQVLDYLRDDMEPFEQWPLETLAARGELMAFIHEGFWQPMDTLRDRRTLQRLWASQAPPWLPPSRTGA